MKHGIHSVGPFAFVSNIARMPDRVVAESSQVTGLQHDPPSASFLQYARILGCWVVEK